MKAVVALALLLVVGVVSVVRGDDRETFGGFSIVQWSSADSRELVTLAGDSAFTGDSLGLTSDAGEERGALWTGRAYRLNTGFLACNAFSPSSPLSFSLSVSLSLHLSFLPLSIFFSLSLFLLVFTTTKNFNDAGFSTFL